MAIYSVVKVGDPILKDVAKEVTKFDDRIKKLAENMLATMYEENGVGLAAPQVGISKRVIVVDDAEAFSPMVIVNPEIIETTGEQFEQEGCLSVPGDMGCVKRAESVRIKGYDVEGNPLDFKAEGMAAVIFQHEIDHLNGILFIDKVEELEEVTE